MQSFPDALRSILVTLWIGALWSVCVLVPAALVRHFDAQSFYGMMGHLFRVLAWVGIVAGGYVVLHALWTEGLSALKTLALWLIIGMLALELVNHFAVVPLFAHVKPEMHTAAEGMFGGGFASWATISSLIYLVQCVLGLLYIIRGAVK